MKKLLVLICLTIIIILLFFYLKQGDLINNEKKILGKIEKKYGQYQGYLCQTSMVLYSGEEDSKYLLEEKYNSPNNYEFKIIEPEESEGITIINTKDKVFIEHPSIDKSISFSSIQSLNNQMLLGLFYENISQARLLGEEEVNRKRYLIFELELEEKNKYRNAVEIWIDKRDYIPYEMYIYNMEGVREVKITYHQFKFTKRNIF